MNNGKTPRVGEPDDLWHGLMAEGAEEALDRAVKVYERVTGHAPAPDVLYQLAIEVSADAPKAEAAGESGEPGEPEGHTGEMPHGAWTRHLETLYPEGRWRDGRFHVGDGGTELSPPALAQVRAMDAEGVPVTKEEVHRRTRESGWEPEHPAGGTPKRAKAGGGA